MTTVKSITYFVSPDNWDANKRQLKYDFAKEVRYPVSAVRVGTEPDPQFKKNKGYYLYVEHK